ncbi:MAG: hypothetical protein OEO19_06240 [Gammaproteobacteria bacterium]|nr:hypothetical protein [Gammaproteobacteria bacterium]MDH3447674.1 hypothetical protein [Gammaproteobacteria bacterium]
MKYALKVVFLSLFSSSVLATGTHSHDHNDMMYNVGKPGKGTPDRVISVSMKDSMRFDFSPELGALKDGEIIEFSRPQ